MTCPLYERVVTPPNVLKMRMYGVIIRLQPEHHDTVDAMRGGETKKSGPRFPDPHDSWKPDNLHTVIHLETIIAG